MNDFLYVNGIDLFDIVQTYSFFPFLFFFFFFSERKMQSASVPLFPPSTNGHTYDTLIKPSDAEAVEEELDAVYPDLSDDQRLNIVCEYTRHARAAFVAREKFTWLLQVFSSMTEHIAAEAGADLIDARDLMAITSQTPWSSDDAMSSAECAAHFRGIRLAHFVDLFDSKKNSKRAVLIKMMVEREIYGY